MKLKVLLFAELRDRVGCRQLELDGAQISDVASLKKVIQRKFPDVSDLVERSSVAINQSYATKDQGVPEDAEIALIPPVSGG